MAWMVQPVMDDIFVHKKETMLNLLPFAIVMLFLFKGLFSYGSVYLISFVGQSVVATLRQRLYDQLQSLSLSFFEQNSHRCAHEPHHERREPDTERGFQRRDRSPEGKLLHRGAGDGRVSSGTGSWRIIAMVVFPLAIIPIVKFGQRMRKISRKNQATLGSMSALSAGNHQRPPHRQGLRHGGV